jgi:hypothetical protein
MKISDHTKNIRDHKAGRIRAFALSSLHCGFCARDSSVFRAITMTARDATVSLSGPPSAKRSRNG